MHAWVGGRWNVGWIGLGEWMGEISGWVGWIGWVGGFVDACTPSYMLVHVHASMHVLLPPRLPWGDDCH